MHVAVLAPWPPSSQLEPTGTVLSALTVRMLEPAAMFDASVSSAARSVRQATVPEASRPDPGGATTASGSGLQGDSARLLSADAPSAGGAERSTHRKRLAAAPELAIEKPVQPSLPAAAAYLNASRLDPGPRPLQEIEPAYPPLAGEQQGLVVLRLLISEKGLVDNAAVVRASPPGFFEESAIEAFSAARFSPGMLLGTPVKSQITIEVEFMPINRGAAVSGRTY